MSDTGLSIVSRDEVLMAEATAFSSHINSMLKNDQDLTYKKLIPLHGPEDLFKNVRDGVLLAKLLNVISPGAINVRSINVNVDVNKLGLPGSRDAWNIAINLNQTIEAAKKLGCKIINIGQEDIVNENRDLILGMVWQLIRFQLTKKVNLFNHPQLIRLLKPSEKVSKLLTLSPEEIITRWFNYHLKNADSKRGFTNFSNDLRDSSLVITLLKQCTPKNELVLEALDEVSRIPDLTLRAERLLDVCEELEVREWVTADDLVKGHGRLNMAFVATIFNSYIGIEFPSEEELEALHRELEQLEREIKACIDGKCNIDATMIERQAQLNELKVQISGSGANAPVNKELLDSIRKSIEEELEHGKTQITQRQNESDTLADKVKEGKKIIAELGDALNEKERNKKKEIDLLTQQIREAEGQEKDLINAISALNKVLSGEGEENSSTIKQKNEAIAKETENKIRLIKEHTALLQATYDELYTNNTGSDNNNTMANEQDSQKPPSFTDVQSATEEATEAESQRQVLKNVAAEQERLINKLADSIHAKESAFEEDKADKQRRLEELSREMAMYMGEGQNGDEEDPMAVLKRLLELMVEKCKKQAQQIKHLEVTIKKTDHLNEVMTEKVREIAEEQTKKQIKGMSAKKKKSFTG